MLIPIYEYNKKHSVTPKNTVIYMFTTAINNNITVMQLLLLLSKSTDMMKEQLLFTPLVGHHSRSTTHTLSKVINLITTDVKILNARMHCNYLVNHGRQ